MGPFLFFMAEKMCVEKHSFALYCFFALRAVQAVVSFRPQMPVVC